MKNYMKELREENNLTQDELAGLVNVSRQTIISLEKGKYNPSIILAYKISKVFNKIIEEVFIFDEED
jgi:putative transcriptional regulator